MEFSSQLSERTYDISDFYEIDICSAGGLNNIVVGEELEKW